jgi:hypothetical protein
MFFPLGFMYYVCVGVLLSTCILYKLFFLLVSLFLRILFSFQTIFSFKFLSSNFSVLGGEKLMLTSECIIAIEKEAEARQTSQVQLHIARFHNAVASNMMSHIMSLTQDNRNIT